ncbi:hypothetical protein R6Q59_027659 [Mikania micrantha]
MVRPALDLSGSMEIRDTYDRLEIHDQQIRQLQSDLNEIKTTLQSLEVERAESAKFRQIVLAWMKHQEQQQVDGSSGTRNSSGFFSSSNFDFGHVPVTTEVLGGLAIHNPSEQLVAIQQLDFISNSIDDVEDIWRPNSVDRMLSLFPFRYQNSFGPLTGKGDGPQVLGQGEPKSVNTPTLMERGLPVCSNKIHSVPFIKSGSIPIEGSASISRDRVVLYPSRLDWKGRKKKRIFLCWGNRYGPANKRPDDTKQGWTNDSLPSLEDKTFK